MIKNILKLKNEVKQIGGYGFSLIGQIPQLKTS